MLDPAVRMRRALRYSAETNGFRPEALDLHLGQLTPALRDQFQDLVISVSDDMQYNQLRYFRPFEHQLRF